METSRTKLTLAKIDLSIGAGYSVAEIDSGDSEALVQRKPTAANGWFLEVQFCDSLTQELAAL